METLLTSTAIVGLAEIGDKTQLLAILLATRFRRPWPIIAGIFLATIANHFFAALIGAEAASVLRGSWFQAIIGLSFVAMGLWTLFPDRLDPLEQKPPRYGAFLTTLIAFFIVEMGDKTQLATVALAARFQSLAWVTAGTTLGMMLANVPAVFLGDQLIERVPLKLVRGIAAMLMIATGAALLIQTSMP